MYCNWEYVSKKIFTFSCVSHRLKSGESCKETYRSRMDEISARFLDSFALRTPEDSPFVFDSFIFRTPADCYSAFYTHLYPKQS